MTMPAPFTAQFAASAKQVRPPEIQGNAGMILYCPLTTPGTPNRPITPPSRSSRGYAAGPHRCPSPAPRDRPATAPG
ncbi:hypothetical protein F6A13_14685 [Acidithiobacillus sp. 'AMD consortium']|nr:hypothetical protein F6A13_14685 [Acidithiobacillus sp. 'AMD consortium']